MTVYAIGDVQGCYGSLCALLDKLCVGDHDELWFCGDLVNRGPESAQVIRLVKGLANARTVLGNHDLNLLAVAEGFRLSKSTDTFDDVLSAADREELLSWLRRRPLAHFDADRATLLVHAGLHPSWTLPQALDLASDVERLLNCDDTYRPVLARMYAKPAGASSGHTDRLERSRWIIDAFTRLRFCDAAGEMDFDHTGPPGSQPRHLAPWFDLRDFDGFRVVFGHWSALGARDLGDVVCLDSGCVYGGALSAFDVGSQRRRFVQVSCS